MTRLLCECNSLQCQETLDIEAEDALRIRRRGMVVIANGCQHGPEDTDRLVEQREGYSLYRELVTQAGQ